MAQVLYELLPVRKEDVTVLMGMTALLTTSGKVLLAVGTELLLHFRTLSATTYMYFTLWLAGAALFIYWDFTSLYVIFTFFLLIFTNLGERKAGEMSAYSVFNEGFTELMGTLNADQVDQQLRHRDGQLARPRRRDMDDEDDVVNDDEDTFSDLLGDSDDEAKEEKLAENATEDTIPAINYEERLQLRHAALMRRSSSSS